MDTKSKLKYYIRRYFQEFLEIFIAYGIYLIFLSEKSFDLYKVVKFSLVIAVLTLLLEEMNKDYKNNLKTGLLGAFGAKLLSI